MMEGSYNLLLVALSYVVAVAASYTAMQLGRRVTETSGIAARVWLGTGAFAMGVGIWTMHFVGMLAFTMPIRHSYDVGLTFISLLVGIIASAFALHTAARPDNNIFKILVSGLILGAGIGAMHYTGMGAMIMEADIVYDPAIVALSVGIAIVAACAAIWIIFTLANSDDSRLPLFKVCAALVMGIAICGTHYTGMHAASYEPWPAAWRAGMAGDNTWMAIVMGAVALIILGVTQLTIFFDYRLSAEKAQGREAERKAVQLSEILDDSTNEIYVFDSESLALINANKGACENLGYSADELSRMTPLDLVPGIDHDSLREFVAPLLDGSVKDRVYQATFRRKDGSEYKTQVHLQVSNLMMPPAIVAIVTDITQKVELENQLAQARKMESIGQLAAGIAHEINTPAQFVGDNNRFVQGAFEDLLALVSQYERLHEGARNGKIDDTLLADVEEAVAAADPEFLREEVPVAIEQSLEGISRISSIVRAMKEFSHPGSRDMETADLNSAIRNTITVASNEWKYVAEVETDLDPDLPHLRCYVQEVNQVILNLIVNAAHAIQDHLADQPGAIGKIRISTGHDDNYIRISVSDSGCGIPDEIRDRIFDPFFTTKEVGKGTGQGLAMAFRTIVKSHQGHLDVESQPGHGTTFHVKLPRNLAANDAVSKEAAA